MLTQRLGQFRCREDVGLCLERVAASRFSYVREHNYPKFL